MLAIPASPVFCSTSSKSLMSFCILRSFAQNWHPILCFSHFKHSISVLLFGANFCTVVESKDKLVFTEFEKTKICSLNVLSSTTSKQGTGVLPSLRWDRTDALARTAPLDSCSPHHQTAGSPSPIVHQVILKGKQITELI